jgi:hypothetical protein
MHREHIRAQFNRGGVAPLLRISLTTVVAVLTSMSLGACERDRMDTDRTTTTAGTPGDQTRTGQPGELGRAGERGLTDEMGRPGTGEVGRTGQMDRDRADDPYVQPSPHQQPTTGLQGTDRDRDDVMARQDVMATKAQQACPMLVDGVNVDVEDTADGIAMRFTTTTRDNVDDLRNRVEKLSRMYGAERGKGEMMWQHMGHKRAEGDRPGTGMGAGRGQDQGVVGGMPPATARVENIDNGARLLLTPTDSGQLSALREHARDHQRRMSGGECWWMHEGKTGEGA